MRALDKTIFLKKNILLWVYCYEPQSELKGIGLSSSFRNKADRELKLELGLSSNTLKINVNLDLSCEAVPIENKNQLPEE